MPSKAESINESGTSLAATYFSLLYIREQPLFKLISNIDLKLL